MHARKIRTDYYSPLFVIPAFILFTIFFILPNISGLFLGFTDWSAFYPLNPGYTGLRNFIQMFTSSVFIISIKNTLYFTIVTVVIKLFFGMILAVILNNAIKFKNLYRTIIFSPMVINQIVVAIIFSAIYNPSKGVLNIFLKTIGLGALQQSWLTQKSTAMNAISAMEIWTGIGIVVVIYLASLQSVPKEYYEASTIDGANTLNQFIHVTIPLTFQATTVSTILCITNGMAVFAQVYGLTNGGPADLTQVYGTFMFGKFSQGLFGAAAAAGLLFSLVMIVISFTLLRFFRKMEVEY